MYSLPTPALITWFNFPFYCLNRLMLCSAPHHLSTSNTRVGYVSIEVELEFPQFQAEAKFDFEIRKAHFQVLVLKSDLK